MLKNQRKDTYYRRRRSALAIGWTDDIWSWEEFLTYRRHHYSKG
jgi:hypothetical protein